MSIGNIAKWLYYSLTGSETTFPLFIEQKQKVVEKSFWDCHGTSTKQIEEQQFIPKHFKPLK